MYFQKMQFLGVFRPFLQRSLNNATEKKFMEKWSTYVVFQCFFKKFIIWKCMICIVKLKKKILRFKLHIDVNQSALHQYLIYSIFFRWAKIHDKLIQFMFKMSKKEDIFEDHAIENHPLSLVLFSKTIKEEIKGQFCVSRFLCSICSMNSASENHVHASWWIKVSQGMWQQFWKILIVSILISVRLWNFKDASGS